MSKPFYTPTVIVGEAVAGEAAATRKELEALIQNVNKSNFDLAELLHKVKSKGYYYPFTTFQEYSATLKLKKRKIQYLTRIAGVFDAVGVPRTVYEPLGVARCREISSLDPDEVWKNPNTGNETKLSQFILGFVEKGEEIPMEELKSHIRTLKGFVGDNDIVWRNIPFLRSVAEGVWDVAIEKAKALIGSTGKDDEGISQDASDAAAAEVLAATFNTDPNSQFQMSDTSNEDDNGGIAADPVEDEDVTL